MTKRVFPRIGVLRTQGREASRDDDVATLEGRNAIGIGGVTRSHVLAKWKFHLG